MKHRLEALDVVLNYRGRLRCDPGWRLDTKWAVGLHDYDLWYVWAGRGRMVTSDGPIDLYPGRGLWMRPGRRYEAEQDRREHLGCLVRPLSAESQAAIARVVGVQATD